MSWASKAAELKAGTALDVPFFDDPVAEQQAKLVFARAYASNGGDKFRAGLKAFPNIEDRGKAMQAPNWFYDPLVQEEIDRLAEATTFLDEVTAERRKAQAEGDRKSVIPLMQLEAEIRKLIKQPGSSNVNIDNRQVNYHLKTPMKPANAEEEASFAARFKAQQTKLVSDARSNRPTN